MKKHGLTGHPIYEIWRGIIKRCYRPWHTAFHRYGGRGIYVCDRWLDPSNFVADVGTRPGPQFTLDRSDNDGPYSPENCRWATWKEQQNNRRNNVVVEFLGIKKPLWEWSKVTGLSYMLLHKRLANGWLPERALTEKPNPVKQRAARIGNSSRKPK